MLSTLTLIIPALLQRPTTPITPHSNHRYFMYQHFHILTLHAEIKQRWDWGKIKTWQVLITAALIFHPKKCNKLSSFNLLIELCTISGMSNWQIFLCLLLWCVSFDCHYLFSYAEKCFPSWMPNTLCILVQVYPVRHLTGVWSVMWLGMQYVSDCIIDIEGCPADQICEIRTYGYNESLVNLFHVSTT